MSLSAIITSIVMYFQKNLAASLAIVIILLYLLFRRPKILVLILFIACILGGVLYLSIYLSSCRQFPLWQ